MIVLSPEEMRGMEIEKVASNVYYVYGADKRFVGSVTQTMRPNGDYLYGCETPTGTRWMSNLNAAALELVFHSRPRSRQSWKERV